MNTHAFRRLPATVAVFGALVVSAACTSSYAATDPDVGVASASDTVEVAGALSVRVDEMAFEPASLTVTAGTTVNWVWQDAPIAHDVVGEGFASEIQSTGTFSHAFEEAGTYRYICSLHPSMTGTIEVTQ